MLLDFELDYEVASTSMFRLDRPIADSSSIPASTIGRMVRDHRLTPYGHNRPLGEEMCHNFELCDRPWWLAFDDRLVTEVLEEMRHG